MTPVVICLSRSGEDVAKRVALALGAPVHGREGRVANADAFFANALDHVRNLFAARVPVVGVCAAGILVRAVAPLLSDKRAEPPVLAVAEDGSTVVPLLGGHRGANRLARRVADAISAVAAVTTAGDLSLGLALDEPPAGWRLANPDDAKPAMAAVLAGAPVVVAGEADWLAATARAGTGAPVTLIATEAPVPGGADRLVYHPQRIALGVGCARNCPEDELGALVDAALAEAGVAPGAVAGVFSLDLKADEAAVNAVARRLGVPLRVFDAATLEAEAPRLATPSEVVFAEVGCHGVAEGAALAAVGPAGTLILDKRKSANATVAIARAPEPLADLPGRARGRVALVGIGPGQAEWRTPEASRLIAEADELVGYGLYIDLLGPLAAGKQRRDFPLGGEEDRCRYALERAAEGVNVAIICSGDAGIYAMGALVFELLDRAAHGVSDAARRVEVLSAPGVSALQAAAARAGAPLGHDFCAISLSDLLTPREDIIRRVRAAAEGDFVIAFYNPVSMRRRTLLAEAREILLRHRPADCPVLLASSLGRPEETIRYRALAELQVDEVDMLTVVLVGSSQSRLARLGEGPRMFTPRGYAKKIEGAA
ncbi:precorrin-3B C(17)-methyltransferase [Limibaculum sp. M0105]|uniref:Precorrin-3B C(17)-methyltransferase n=1 Tax=Thermohalobaculum xanthum TaxID=2753746 RepID=A0A8J7M5J9_9RHOB|nr:precorrin-3B C(17)-methyltransferase [Thermohalobaculum xanthum]MBK0397824.1 precorrin-3B C(17)-methyltransferase [Thermohalobaculum xanthum]